MNSLTHSCMHSFASLAILAFSGNAVFIIRATGAKLRILASDARLSFDALLLVLCVPSPVSRTGDSDCGEVDDMACGEQSKRIDAPRSRPTVKGGPQGECADSTVEAIEARD